MVGQHQATSLTKSWAIDAAERVGFLALYAAIGEATTLLPEVKNSYVPIIMLGLGALKALVAKKIGPPGSAALISNPSVAAPSMIENPTAPSGGV